MLAVIEAYDRVTHRVLLQTMRGTVWVAAALAGCTGAGLDRAGRLDSLVTDGNELYYLRDDEIMRGDGRRIASGAERTRALALDDGYVYALDSNGSVARYPRDGGSRQELLPPDGVWHSDVHLAVDSTNVYELAIDTDNDLFLPEVTVSYRIVAKAGGDATVVDPERVVISRITGDGVRGFGLRWRLGSTVTTDIVELGAEEGRSIMPMPDNGFGMQLVGGSLYVLGFDGLWRVDANGLAWVHDEVPSHIATRGAELFGIVGAAGDEGCRVLALGTKRCLYEGEPGEIAFVRDSLYFTYFDRDQWVLDTLDGTN